MGARLGNYEILRKLGAGGMAEVLLAKHLGIGGFERLVCLKRILPQLSVQEDFVRMFLDEARIAAQFTHPNIVQIYEINEADGAYYIAMEYVRGEDVRRIYNQEVKHRKPIPLAIAAQIIMGAAAGLDYAHRQTDMQGRPLGIVHRDVSPQNILVSYDGHVKLLDFGVAKAAGKMGHTRSGVLKGKYSYMSPEQASGEAIDGRSDIFALGTTLYEITTGVRLFKRENELETLHAVIACQVKLPSNVIPGYDPALENIVMRALHHDPNQRFQTAGEMERALDGYLRQKNIAPHAAILADYMHELFADKLADEALFGGKIWEETNTYQAEGPGAPHAKEALATDERTGQYDRTAQTEGAAANAKSDSKHPDATKIVASHGTRDASVRPARMVAQATERSHAAWRTYAPRTDWGEETDGGMGEVTRAFDPDDGSGPEAMPKTPTQAIHAESLGQGPTERRMRWLASWLYALLFLSGAFGIMLIGGAKYVDVQTNEPRSKMIVMDSDPRGAFVEFVGNGAEALNARYSEYRTPFAVVEGLPLHTTMRARFTLQGYAVLERELPQLPTDDTEPEPFVVQLDALSAEQKAEKKSSAALTVLSDPKGAEVWIDGKTRAGVTPLTALSLPGNTAHDVVIKLAGYRNHQESIYMQAGGSRVLDVRLRLLAEPLPAVGGNKRASQSQKVGRDNVVNGIADTSRTASNVKGARLTNDTKTRMGNPSAQDTGTKKAYLTIVAPLQVDVWLGSNRLGHAPLYNIPLTADVHMLRFVSPADGYSKTQEVRLIAGQKQVIDLGQDKGKLIIRAAPWGWVKLGERTAQETPVSLELYAGHYDFTFECPDGIRQRHVAVVDPDKTTTMNMTCASK